MRRLLLACMFLSLCSAANADFRISVNGVTDPPEEVWLAPSDTAILDICTGTQYPEPIAFWMLVRGPGSIAGGVGILPEPPWRIQDMEELAENVVPPMPPEDYLKMFREFLGMPDLTDVATYESLDAPVGPGKIVDEIIFHCEDIGESTLMLVNWDEQGNLLVYDTQIIHQIPEPMTIALFAIGGAAILRRKR